MFYIIGALFAIVIGVILTINVLGGGSQGSSGSQISTTVNEINQFRVGVKSLGYTNNFTGIDNDVLEVGGVMPPELIAGVVGAGDDLNTWGGAVLVGPEGGYSQGFYVAYNGVPQAACVALTSQVASSSPPGLAPDYGDVQINGAMHGSVQQPLNPTLAAASCTNSNQIYWFFND